MSISRDYPPIFGRKDVRVLLSRANPRLRTGIGSRRSLCKTTSRLRPLPMPIASMGAMITRTSIFSKQMFTKCSRTTFFSTTPAPSFGKRGPPSLRPGGQRAFALPEAVWPQPTPQAKLGRSVTPRPCLHCCWAAWNSHGGPSPAGPI